MTADLVDQLRAALDHAEQLARSCQAEVGTLKAGDPYEDGSGIADQDAFPSYPWGSGQAELAFMAANGPDAALRTIGGHRKLLDWHSTPDHHCHPEPVDREWVVHEGRRRLVKAYPCGHLRLLLDIYLPGWVTGGDDPKLSLGDSSNRPPTPRGS